MGITDEPDVREEEREIKDGVWLYDCKANDGAIHWNGEDRGCRRE